MFFKQPSPSPRGVPLGDLEAALKPTRLKASRDGDTLVVKHERLLTRVEVTAPGNADAGDLRGKLLIGLHSDVEVTDAPIENMPRVSQAFCSALPVAYTRISPSDWNAFATLILEAAYEATMLAAVRNAQRGMSNRVLLTRLGGGAFGNHDDWIDAAMRRSLAMMRESDLDVQIVSYGEPSKNILQIAKEYA